MGRAQQRRAGTDAEIEAWYEKDETDEFLMPIILKGEAGRIKGVCSGWLAAPE